MRAFKKQNASIETGTSGTCTIPTIVPTKTRKFYFLLTLLSYTYFFCALKYITSQVLCKAPLLSHNSIFSYLLEQKRIN